MSVFVLDRKKKPLTPCSEKRARLLLTRGKAMVDRMYPFTIRLKEREGGVVQPVLDLAAIAHKGALVRKRIEQRSTYRQRRRSAHLRRRANLDPRARGGSDRVSKLTLACVRCNQKKGVLSIEVFLAQQPPVLERVLARAKSPLRDAAALNTTRWALVNQLRKTGLKRELSSGGGAKWNRVQGSISKTHAWDAACVGERGWFDDWRKPVLQIGCAGRGAYHRSRVDSFGFPGGMLLRAKQVRGFQTGDMVRAVVAQGVRARTWIGRVAVRVTGRFNLQTGSGVRQGIAWKCRRLFEPSDRHKHSTTKGGASSPCLKAGVSAPMVL